MLEPTENISDSISFEANVPKPGQLVEVRRRQWVVSDITGSTFSSGEQHLVTLASLDEDALGEELQVIWQLEPGVRVFEKAGFPEITGWDSNDIHEAFLDAVRWGAVTNADRSFLQAPFRSGISIENFQLDPLVRAIDMARANLLIADDVGLGKTIEAGLVIQELLVRHRARTVFVVCPASLQVKWQDEMWEKFGLDFRIVDTAYIRKLRRERGLHANPWTSYPRLISSIDWMKKGEGLRLMKDILPPHVTYPRKFDILVVDEAHNVAPAAATRYALESQRTRLIRTIVPHFENRLFLSATPHNGYQESFTALLELLDDQRFARTVMPNEKQLQRVMVRRLKTDLVDENGDPLYPKRVLLPLEVDYSEEEQDIHRLLQEFTESRIESVKGTRQAFGTEFVHKLLKKRLFSSPLAFATTLAKHKESLERGRTKKTDSKIDERILRTAILRAEEEYANDANAEDAQHEAVDIVGELSAGLTDDQRTQLDRLIVWADRAKNQVDSKAAALLAWLKTHLKTNGKWNNKRVILFTEYRATHSWLHQLLSTHDFGGDRLEVIHGGLLQEEREPIKAAFQAHPDISPVRILLATDAASEGIDLQNYCNCLIHIEIPWNPNIMEQRNGRIDRHGQKEKEVCIWHPVGKGFKAEENRTKKVGKIEGDHEFLMRAVIKIDAIREDLGSVGPVIAGQIEEAMLGRRSTLNTAGAEAKAAKARRFVAAERKLSEKIGKLHEKLMEAKKDYHLSPEHISRAVAVALKLAKKPALEPTTLNGVPDGTVFNVPFLPGSWGRATVGLEHPHTKERRPITFDHEVAKGRDDVVLAHLNHRLVQMSLRLLREELWKLDDVKKLHRVTVRVLPNDEMKNPVAIVYARLVITGKDHHRLHEEITLAGGELKHTGFARILQIGRLNSLVETSEPLEPSVRLFEILKKRFQNQEQPVQSAVGARSRDRLKYLENTLRLRMESEKKDICTLLDELEKNIREELHDESKPTQFLLPGFTDEEKNQVRRDLAALENRLTRIPEEKKQESAVIEKRYSGLIDRTFPVAVVFLVPRSMAEEV